MQIFVVSRAECAPKGPPVQGGWTFDKGLSLGFGAAYMKDAKTDHNFVPSLDATFFKRIKRHLSFWGSLGAKLPVSNNNTAFVPYIETGFNMMLVNLGVGYGPVIDDSISQQINLFAGFALPIKPANRNRVVVAQLYYRPVFNFGNEQFWMSHEVGILFKWLLIFKVKTSQTKESR